MPPFIVCPTSNLIINALVTFEKPEPTPIDCVFLKILKPWIEPHSKVKERSDQNLLDSYPSLAKIQENLAVKVWNR